jgi:hypothetical protein
MMEDTLAKILLKAYRSLRWILVTQHFAED